MALEMTEEIMACSLNVLGQLLIQMGGKETSDLIFTIQNSQKATLCGKKIKVKIIYFRTWYKI